MSDGKGTVDTKRPPCREKVDKSVHAVLVSVGKWVDSFFIDNEYFNIERSQIPFEAFGFRTIDEYLTSLDGRLLSVLPRSWTTPLYQASHIENTNHILTLVQNQRPPQFRERPAYRPRAPHVRPFRQMAPAFPAAPMPAMLPQFVGRPRMFIPYDTRMPVAFQLFRQPMRFPYAHPGGGNFNPAGEWMSFAAPNVDVVLPPPPPVSQPVPEIEFNAVHKGATRAEGGAPERQEGPSYVDRGWGNWTAAELRGLFSVELISASLRYGSEYAASTECQLKLLQTLVLVYGGNMEIGLIQKIFTDAYGFPLFGRAEVPDMELAKMLTKEADFAVMMGGDGSLLLHVAPICADGEVDLFASLKCFKKKQTKQKKKKKDESSPPNREASSEADADLFATVEAEAWTPAASTAGVKKKQTKQKKKKKDESSPPNREASSEADADLFAAVEAEAWTPAASTADGGTFSLSNLLKQMGHPTTPNGVITKGNRAC